jgi:O-antigen/teichoic acid export membrane protein
MTTVVNSAFGFAFWVLVARLFLPRIVGATAAIISAAVFVNLVASLGLGGTLIHRLPGQKGSPTWSSTFWAGTIVAVAASLVLSIGAVIVLPAMTSELDKLHEVAYASIFVAGTAALTSGAVFDCVFISERSAGNMFTRNAITAAAKLLVVIAFTAVLGKNALDLLGAWASASILGVVFGFLLLKRRVELRRLPRPAVLVRITVEFRSVVAGHQFIGMGAALLPYVLPLIVTARLSATQNAYFYTTWMMAGLFLIISPALSHALFAEGANDPGGLTSTTRSALGVIGAVLVPCVIVGIVWGGMILSVFGEGYRHHAVGLLRIALLASIPDAITNVYVSVLRVRNRLAAAAGLNMAMGIGIVVLSWLLLPALGISAVGWAFLAMQLCGCVFVVFDMGRSTAPTGNEQSQRVGRLERLSGSGPPPRATGLDAR